MVYIFGDYEVHTDTCELLHLGSPQKIEPLTFNLLKFMLENPERVLSHDELINAVWTSSEISNSALCATICAARRAIGDSGRNQKCIKTVSGCGYRFIAMFTCIKDNKEFTKSSASTLQTYQQDDADQSSKLPDLTTASHLCMPPESLELPDKPSVAIMDILEIGSSKEGYLLAHGLTVDINSSLARLPHLFVITRASAASQLIQNLSSKEVSRRLGVRYLVYGNVQRLSRRVRITVSVVDATRDTEIWSEHFDRSLDDLFLVQDEITRAIVMTIDSTIEQAEIERAVLVPPENLSAWEFYHQGLFHINRTTYDAVELAQRLFKKATLKDPRFSRAYAGLSYTYTSHALLCMSTSMDDDMAQALDYAKRSIEYGIREAMGYWSLGRLMFLSGEHEQALSAYDRALQLNPNYYHCSYGKALVSAHAGLDSSVPLYLDAAQRLSPFDPLQFSIKTIRAISLVNQGKYDEAAAWSVSAANEHNAYFTTYAVTSACLELTGHTTDAQHYAAKTLKLNPDYSVDNYRRTFPYVDESARSIFINAMLKSGIPKVSAHQG